MAWTWDLFLYVIVSLFLLCIPWQKNNGQPFWVIRYCLEVPPRIELGIKELQSTALPLGYGTVWSG